MPLANSKETATPQFLLTIAFLFPSLLTESILCEIFEYLIPYNEPPLKKFPDPKVSFIRPLGSLLGIEISTPNCPHFGDIGGQILNFDPLFSENLVARFPPNFNTMYHLVISIDDENFMQDP